jgi:hypothetical protein
MKKASIGSRIRMRFASAHQRGLRSIAITSLLRENGTVISFRRRRSSTTTLYPVPSLRKPQANEFILPRTFSLSYEACGEKTGLD